MKQVDTDESVSVFHQSSNELLDSYKTTYYFDQLIDHSDPSKGTFKQRYWHNYEFYETGGPIVIMTPGEQDASGFTGYLTNVTVVGLLAQQLNGSAIVIEHRFFGQSNPYPDLSVASLQVHTLQQAIDDLEYFAKTVKLPQPNGDQLAPGKAPWILVGGSYPGALTSYTMYNKPGLFYAGWASSGVVQAIADFWKYFEPERQNMPQNCSADIVTTVDYIDSVFASGSPEEIWAMKQNFGLGALTYADDFASALLSYGGIYDWQEDIPSVLAFCDTIEGKNAPAGGQGLDHTFKAWGKYWNETIWPSYCSGGTSADAEYCFGGLHNASLPYYTNTTLPNAGRSWEWMICDEFGFWQVAAPADQPSLVSRQYDVASNERTCGYFFPDAFTGPQNSSSFLKALAVNKAYGGWNVTTERLVFVNGELDPWRDSTVGAVGANPTWSEEWQPHLLHDEGHCADLIIDSRNTPLMKQVQKEGLAAIGRWMADWQPTSNSTSSAS